MSDEFRTLFQIPAANLEKFEANLAKLSKKAVKLGLDPILPFVASNELKRLSDGREHRVYNVHLMCDVPKLNGWVFAGRLDHSQETGTLVRAVPNFSREIPESYRTAMPACDHCKVRRYRRDSYIVCHEETGEFRQVGSTCLADFMGHDAYRTAKLAEFLSYALQYGRAGEQFVGADQRFIDTELFLGYAAWAVRKFGWVSGSAAKDRDDITATRSLAADNLLRSHYYTGGIVDEHGFMARGIGYVAYEEPSEEDYALAAEAHAWVLGFEQKASLSEYESNVLVVAKAVTLEYRHLGLAASIVGVYANNKAREAKAKHAAPQGESKHVGKPDERLNFGAARVLHVTPLENYYGTKYLYGFLTDQGDVVKWFANKSQGLLRGERVTLVGTVKSHDIYNGNKQTIITRAKVEREQEAKAA